MFLLVVMEPLWCSASCALCCCSGVRNDNSSPGDGAPLFWVCGVPSFTGREIKDASGTEVYLHDCFSELPIKSEEQLPINALLPHFYFVNLL